MRTRRDGGGACVPMAYSRRAEGGRTTLTVRYGLASGATARAVFQTRYVTPFSRCTGTEATSAGSASPIKPSTPLTRRCAAEPPPCCPGESLQVKTTSVVAPGVVRAEPAAQLVAARHNRPASGAAIQALTECLTQLGMQSML